MQLTMSVGSVSWIQADPNPIWTSAQAEMLDPDWVPKTYLGLAGTKNNAPPNPLPDFAAYRADQDFRSMTYCGFQLTIDDTTWKLVSFVPKDPFYDPGWTPYFKLRHWALSIFSFDSDIIWGWSDFPGEASQLSNVEVRRRHKNTAIAGVAATEDVLVNSIVKFRAGSHTDDVGVKKVGCPYHVPWVWCETLLTYSSADRALKLYGMGSIFPSHAWYLDTRQRLDQKEVGDTMFPTTTVVLNPNRPPGARQCAMPYPRIVLGNLKLYPVLSAGAPASGPQRPLFGEADLPGPVDGHPNTASAGSDTRICLHRLG